jgi:hypothetical protein
MTGCANSPTQGVEIPRLNTLTRDVEIVEANYIGHETLIPSM